MFSRRNFLLGIGSASAVTALSSCTINSSRSPNQSTATALAVEPIVNPKTLEKPNLTIGYVPVNDCAPFAVAWEKGIFRKYGLNVRLSRESSWANSRDGLIFGRLDASPVVSGAITNARTGAEGARAAPICGAMTIHRHGNAMTMDKGMWNSGLRPWQDYDGNLEYFGQDLRTYLNQMPMRERVWAVVLSSSIYEYFIRYLVSATGINPVAELRVLVIPPPQMVNNMRIGSTQAYMVAEPWNTRAITGNEGIGFTFIQGRQIWNGHPDRILAVMESFIEKNPKTYRSLVKAMIEACQFCSKPENRPEVAKIIAQRSFTGVQPKLTEPGIVGDYNFGGFDDKKRILDSVETTLFFDMPPDVAKSPHDHSTFLWQSESLWLMTQAARWQQIPGIPANAEAIAKQAWRTDLYREIAAEMGITCPAEDYYIAPAKAFIDQKLFDPSDLVGYLNSFEIRANTPQKFYLS